MEPFADFIQDVGQWMYYCLILKDFDPRAAKELFNETTVEELVNALRAKYHYEKPPPDA